MVNPIQFFVSKSPPERYKDSDEHNFLRLQIDMGGGIYGPPDISNWADLYNFGNNAFKQPTFINMRDLEGRVRSNDFRIYTFMDNGGKIYKDKFLSI